MSDSRIRVWIAPVNPSTFALPTLKRQFHGAPCAVSTLAPACSDNPDYPDERPDRLVSPALRPDETRCPAAGLATRCNTQAAWLVDDLVNRRRRDTCRIVDRVWDAARARQCAVLSRTTPARPAAVFIDIVAQVAPVFADSTATSQPPPYRPQLSCSVGGFPAHAVNSPSPTTQRDRFERAAA